MTTWQWKFKATPIRVVDGDGIIFAASVGFKVTVQVDVRLAGCNAAAGKTPEGQAATAYVTDWLSQHADAKGQVQILTHNYAGDPHGRWLAEVQSTDGIHDLTDDLIAAGHAVAYDGTGPKPGE